MTMCHGRKLAESAPARPTKASMHGGAMLNPQQSKELDDLRRLAADLQAESQDRAVAPSSQNRARSHLALVNGRIAELEILS